jgi:hypothetical protein
MYVICTWVDGVHVALLYSKISTLQLDSKMSEGPERTYSVQLIVGIRKFPSALGSLYLD